MELKLIPERIIELKEEVKKCYSNEHNLVTLLTDYKNIFDNVYNELWGNNLDSKISNLVDELYKRELLQSFLKISGKKYQYQKLREYSALLIVYNKASPFLKVLEIISRKDDKFIFTLFSDYIEYTQMEDFEQYLTKKIDNEYLSLVGLGFSDLSELESLSSYPFLKDLLDRSYYQILSSDVLNEEDKENFKNWINDNFDYNIPINAPESDQPLQSYLLILIKTHRGQTIKSKSKTFDVMAELIEDFNQKYLEHKKNIKVELKPEKTKESYSAKEIPDVIYQYICEVQRNEAYLGAKNIAGLFYELKVELFLPRELLTKDFEFKIPGVLKKEKYAICEKHPVVVRSLDRLQLQHLELRNSWISKWNSFLKFSLLKTLDFESSFFDFDRSSKDQNTIPKLELYLKSSNKHKQLRNKLNEVLVLIISCGLPRPKNHVSCLLDIIIEAGIPLCIWIKSKNNIEDETYQAILKQLDRLINKSNFEDSDRLSAKIFELRKIDLAQDKPQQYLGFHLRIMYEHFDRIPFAFSGSNQLISD